MKVKGRGGKLTLALLCYWLVCLHGTYFCFLFLFFYCHMLKLKGFFVEVSLLPKSGHTFRLPAWALSVSDFHVIVQEVELARMDLEVVLSKDP